ncbi:MAG: 2-phospho-L-lactate guanylyltransferase [Streptosporangiaceae bacterium]
MDEISWSLIVPVKSLTSAKSRLAAAAGEHREALVLAMACDTVAAALACPLVAAVLAVTDDPLLAAELTGLGAAVAPDPGTGLNPALRYGSSMLSGAIGAINADLPALRSAELTGVLAGFRAGALAGALETTGGRAFVADADGTGTTLYLAGPGTVFAPAFGPDSRARHRALGLRELPAGPGLRRDVDTLEDLRAALELGLGPRTEVIADKILAAQ